MASLGAVQRTGRALTAGAVMPLLRPTHLRIVSRSCPQSLSCFSSFASCNARSTSLCSFSSLFSSRSSLRGLRPFSTEESATEPLTVQHPHPTIVPVDHPGYIPEKNTFAIVELMSRQHKVQVGSLVMVPHMAGVEIGTELVLEKVLMVGTPHDTVIGRPFISGATVKATVQEHTHTRTLLAFKMRRRKSSKRLKGIRPLMTIVHIDSVDYN